MTSLEPGSLFDGYPLLGAESLADEEESLPVIGAVTGTAESVEAGIDTTETTDAVSVNAESTEATKEAASESALADGAKDDLIAESSTPSGKL